MKINKYLDWFIHMLGYALVLVTVSIIFKKTVYIDNSYYGLWGLIAVIIIFALNRTIKPLLVWITLPLTAVIHGTFMVFIVSIIISIMNAIMDNIIIDVFLKGMKK